MSTITIHMEKPKHFTPKVEIAVGWLHSNDEFLFLQSPQQSFNSLQWGCPGGKIESQESPDDALVREVFEETNINLTKRNIITMDKLYVERDDYGNYTYHMFYYDFMVKPNVKISQEHKDYTWKSLEEARQLRLIPGTVETMEIFSTKKEAISTVI